MVTRLPTPADSRVVLIGCARYKELPALPTVTAGLVDLQTALTNPDTGGFAPNVSQVIPDPGDAAALGRELLAAARASTDTLLVFYSGHGVLDERNHLHLALTGTSTDPALVPVTALAYDRVRDILAGSTARNRVVILDCCFAGRALHDMAADTMANRAAITGSYVLTATAADHAAVAPPGDRYTAFTSSLLNLLQHGIPDGPDLLTLETLFPYLSQDLMSRGLPGPRRQGTDTVNGLALTRNPAVRPGATPSPRTGTTLATADVHGPLDVPGPPGGELSPPSGKDGAGNNDVQGQETPGPSAESSPIGSRRRLLMPLGVLLAGAFLTIGYMTPHLPVPDATPASPVPMASPTPAVSTPPAWTTSTRPAQTTSTRPAQTTSAGPTRTPRRAFTLVGHTDNVRAVAWAPDGTALATASDDKTVRIWNLAAGKLLRTLTGHTDAVWGVAWAPGGTMLASASTDRTVRIWDPDTGKLLRTLTGHTDYVWGVAWAPDSSTLATTSDDRTVRIWDPDTGKLLRTLTGHTDFVRGVAWAPDGTALATASRDRTVRIWDPDTGKLLRTLTGHTNGVEALAWAPDGTALATASDDRTVRIWDPDTGKLLRTLTGHRGGVRGVAWAPDGTALATASLDKTARIWPTQSTGIP